MFNGIRRLLSKQSKKEPTSFDATVEVWKSNNKIQWFHDILPEEEQTLFPSAMKEVNVVLVKFHENEWVDQMQMRDWQGTSINRCQFFHHQLKKVKKTKQQAQIQRVKKHLRHSLAVLYFISRQLRIDFSKQVQKQMNQMAKEIKIKRQISKRTQEIPQNPSYASYTLLWGVGRLLPM